MAKDTRVFHIMHVSSQYTDSMEKTVEDLKFCFDQQPDVITFTEMRPGTARQKRMSEMARNRGYRDLIGPGDCQLVVRTEDPNIRVKNKGSQPVHGGVAPSHPGVGFYGDKHLSWGHIGFHGEDIFVSVSHWAVRAQEGGIYREHFNKMANAVVNKLLAHSERGIAFATGDINADPDEGKFPHELFRKNRIKTCWDEANAEPGTRHSRNIDIVARHGENKQAEFKRYKIWRGLNSDHRPFSVWYEIDVTKKQSPGGSGNGGGGKGGKGGKGDKGGGKEGGTQPDGKFYTAGGRSFKDYKDKTLYDLPQAVDDSDLFNG